MGLIRVCHKHNIHTHTQHTHTHTQHTHMHTAHTQPNKNVPHLARWHRTKQQRVVTNVYKNKT